MSDVMDVTKLSKGSLYVHFKDKDELAQAVVDYNLQLLEKKISAAIGKEQTSKGKLFAFMDVLTDVLNPPVTGGCPIINFGVEADDTNPAVAAQVLEAIDYTQKLLTGIIRQGIAAGEFREDWNYKDFPVILFSAIEGAIVFSRVAGNNKKVKVVTAFFKQLINDQVS